MLVPQDFPNITCGNTAQTLTKQFLYFMQENS